MKLACVLLIISLLNTQICAKEENKVLEMDDRLIDYSTQGKWLITFYAPWCGHCRRLEPVMDEVAKYYTDKLIINIARLDATRFIKAANHFDIKAYPTIKFIYGKTRINYSGERRKEDLIDFISKADAPRVTRAIHQLDFEHNKAKHKHLFLIVATPQDEEKKIVKEYFEMANRYFLDAYFFYATPDQVAKTAVVYSTPKIGVIKENELIYYESNKQSLEEFIKHERFLTFTEVTMSNFYNLIETGKMLMILNLNSEDKNKEKQTRKIKQNFKIFSKTSRSLYHDQFQFGYAENSDLLNGIAIWTLPQPILFIFNTTTHQYCLATLIDEKNKVIDLDIEKLINDVRQNKLEFSGGQGFFRSIRRPLWELYRAIIEMFYEAPFLSLLIFGFPFGVISIVCYFLCCVDSTDQSDPEDDEFSDTDEEDEHQQLLNKATQLENTIENAEQISLSNQENILSLDPDKIRMTPIKASKKTQ